MEISDLLGSGFVWTSKNRPYFWVSSCEGGTEQCDSALDTFSPKAFVLSSIAPLVKTVFSLDSDPGSIPDLWCRGLEIWVFNKCARWSLGKEVMIGGTDSLLQMGKPRPSRALTSPWFWIWFLWLLLMKNGGLRHQNMTLNTWLSIYVLLPT